MENIQEKTTEDLIHEILEGSKDTIKANIVEGLKKSIMESLSWNLRQQVSSVTEEFVKAELKDEILTILKSQKPVILEEMKGAFIKIGASVAQAMYEQAAKNLDANSYQTSEILKRILG